MATHLGAVPSNRAEMEMLKEFMQQLPCEWIVVSDVSWAIAGENGYVQDGQADLVVLAPGQGMVVVEVKGSRRIWVDDDGRWYREDPRGTRVLVAKPPPLQAMGNMHQIAGVVAKKGGWPAFPGRYSWIVAYPFGQANQLPALYDDSTLITRRQMHDLHRRVRLALERRGNDRRGAEFTADIAKEAGRILTSQPFVVDQVDTPSDVREHAAQIDQLTRQQFAALRGVFEFTKVAVTGPAGSGKTLLAIWRLMALLEAGKRALYVCYNKDLAAILRRRNPEAEDAIVHVDSLFRGLLPAASRRPVPSMATKYFREELPSDVFELASGLREEEKYDAIIVDEGQDFSDYQLLALNELQKAEGGQWLIFSDRNQDIFKPGSQDEVGAEVVFKLYYNCRNTVEINDATNRYVQARDRIASMPGMPLGEAPRVELRGKGVATANMVWEIARDWATENGVVVLSPYTLEKSSMAGSASGHGMSLTSDLGAIGVPGKVYFSTIRGFKGIEAPAVILIDVDIPREGEASPLRREDLYVACTRPTARLAVVTSSQEAAEWFTQVPGPPAAPAVR